MNKLALPHIIENSKLNLRKHSTDLAYQMYQTIDEARNRLRIFLPWVDHMKSVDDQIWYINDCLKDWDDRTMFDYGIFDVEGAYLGNIGVHTISWQDDRCELGYWICPDQEGKGYISSAVQMLEKTLFGVGFHRIEIRCDPQNVKSAAVPIRNEYIFEGTLKQSKYQKGNYRDTAVYAKLRN